MIESFPPELLDSLIGFEPLLMKVLSAAWGLLQQQYYKLWTERIASPKNVVSNYLSAP